MPKKDSRGVFKTPHGGTAIACQTGFGLPFAKDDDATQLWDKLWQTKRIAGAWLQVLPRTRLLSFSFYGYASSADPNYHAMNDSLLSDLLTICAQFGDIPIVIGGDFQCEPGLLESFAHAQNVEGWADPL